MVSTFYRTIICPLKVLSLRCLHHKSSCTATGEEALPLRFFYHRKRGVWSVWLLAVILLPSCGREADQTDKAAVAKEDMNQGDGVGEVKDVNSGDTGPENDIAKSGSAERDEIAKETGIPMVMRKILSAIIA